jgi:Domain of unknown function (DUF4214)
MGKLWNRLTKQLSSANSSKNAKGGFPRFEELETRNLLTAVLPFTLAQQLRRGFSGYTPAQIGAAYGISQLSVSKPGSGETIAIVDAFQSPDIQADLSTFDAKFNLPAINLTVVNDGATKQDPTGGWEMETALDVEWAHAIAPYANIVLVEAANDATNSSGVPEALLHSVGVASSQTAVSVVSISWGVSEFSTEAQFDTTFSTPGVTYVAASGDSGTPPIWPAVSPNVVAVGGTTLQSTSTSGVFVETGWGNGSRSGFRGGSGGGLSQFESEPTFQSAADYVSSVTSSQNSTGMRESPDVAYDANPSTGVAVYDQANGGWQIVGGTSAGTPQWAALIAIADQIRAAAGSTSLSSSQTLTGLYQAQADFYDVTSGNNGQAASSGYDLVTGLGTPIANLLVPDLASLATAAGTNTTDPARSTSSGDSGNGGSGSSNADFTLTGAQVTATSGTSFNGTIATITGAPSGDTASSFTALILWGDGTVSQGTVTADPSGGFDVTGTHTYTIRTSPGWGEGWGGYQFGWGCGGGSGSGGGGSGSGSGGSSGSSSGSEEFRITIIVGETSSQQYALAYSTATVSAASSGGSSGSSASQLYINQLFQTLLGRTADGNALSFWSSVLNSGNSRSAVVSSITQSTEYRTDQVQAIFEKLLQRQADAAGLTAFTNALANGATLQQCEATIAGSQEFFQARGQGQASTFIDALFADALNRTADAAGAASLEGILSQGASRGAVASLIFGSQEYSRDLVASYYQTYLGRQADSGGLGAFVNILQHGGSQAVLGGILGSQEYFQKSSQ